MSRLINADKWLISRIQLETGCNFITGQKIVDSRPTIHAIPIDKVKAAREEISKASRDSYEELAQTFYNDAIKDAVAILDRLIAESEDNK